MCLGSNTFFFNCLICSSSSVRPLRAQWLWKVWRCVHPWPVSGIAAPAAARLKPLSSTCCGTVTRVRRCLVITTRQSLMKSLSERQQGAKIVWGKRMWRKFWSVPKPRTCITPQGKELIICGKKSTVTLLNCSSTSSSTISFPSWPTFSRSLALTQSDTPREEQGTCVCPALRLASGSHKRTQWSSAKLGPDFRKGKFLLVYMLRLNHVLKSSTLVMRLPTDDKEYCNVWMCVNVWMYELRKCKCKRLYLKVFLLPSEHNSEFVSLILSLQIRWWLTLSTCHHSKSF